MPVSFSENTEELENFLGYRFKERGLLREALTHTSFYHENAGDCPRHNERLEFLGDSVLGLVIAEKLFLVKDQLTEAEMSRMKSFLVKESVLFEVASSLSLGRYLLLGKGEETTGGRQKRSVLSDAVEALFGALFLDSDYVTVRSVVLTLLSGRISTTITSKEGYDFKSELQERCQAILGQLPEYRIVKQEGEEHRKVFTSEVFIQGRVFGRGAGKSKKDAQMAAAKEALERLG
ncbi:MAG: ribonuclease III [Nitrospirales bacterium]|nr:ribonuclease III [Nitrospirales bacterium]